MDTSSLSAVEGFLQVWTVVGPLSGAALGAGLAMLGQWINSRRAEKERLRDRSYQERKNAYAEMLEALRDHGSASQMYVFRVESITNLDVEKSSLEDLARKGDEHRDAFSAFNVATDRLMDAFSLLSLVGSPSVVAFVRDRVSLAARARVAAGEGADYSEIMTVYVGAVIEAGHKIRELMRADLGYDPVPE